MAMESIQTNNHSVPVLAVDSVEGMLEFASGRTQITQGRSISQEEYCDGAAVCLDHFGASAPAKVLYEKFGFTAEHVAETAKAVLNK